MMTRVCVMWAAWGPGETGQLYTGDTTPDIFTQVHNNSLRSFLLHFILLLSSLAYDLFEMLNITIDGVSHIHFWPGALRELKRRWVLLNIVRNLFLCNRCLNECRSKLELMWQSKIDFREREEINIHILVKNVASTDVLWIGHVFCDSGDMTAGVFLPQSSESLCCCCPRLFSVKSFRRRAAAVGAQAWPSL